MAGASRGLGEATVGVSSSRLGLPSFGPGNAVSVMEATYSPPPVQCGADHRRSSWSTRRSSENREAQFDTYCWLLGHPFSARAGASTGSARAFSAVSGVVPARTAALRAGIANEIPWCHGRLRVRAPPGRQHRGLLASGADGGGFLLAICPVEYQRAIRESLSEHAGSCRSSSAPSGPGSC